MFRSVLSLLLASAVASILAPALRAQEPLPAHVWRIADAPAELKPAISKADIFIASQHSALIGQLGRALAEGPAAALQACHLAASADAFWVGRRYGYPIGRTSDRLRSPTNAPEAWAAPMVSEYAGRKAAEVEGFAADLGDRIGVLRPIAMQPICATCHGEPDKITPAIREALADRYPRDHATGFKTGDIRGWYWVEVPKKDAGR